MFSNVIFTPDLVYDLFMSRTKKYIIVQLIYVCKIMSRPKHKHCQCILTFPWILCKQFIPWPATHLILQKNTFIFTHFINWNIRSFIEHLENPTIQVTSSKLFGRQALISALFNSGFGPVPGHDGHYAPCPVGTFSNSSHQIPEGCTRCPPGMARVVASNGFVW